MKQLNDFSPLRALQLEEFEIDCANFNDSALDAVAKPSLSKLSFPSENVSDTGLKRLAEAAENLEELELFQKELVANCGLKEILSKCQRLRVLTLRTNLLDFEVFKQLGQCEALRKLRISRLDIAIENSMRLLLESRVERNIKSDLEVTVDIYFPHEESEVDMSEFNTELLANTIRLHIGTLDTSKMPKKVFEVAIAPRVTRSNWSFWPEGFDFDSLKNSLGSVQNTLQN